MLHGQQKDSAEETVYAADVSEVVVGEPQSGSLLRLVPQKCKKGAG